MHAFSQEWEQSEIKDIRFKCRFMFTTKVIASEKDKSSFLSALKKFIHLIASKRRNYMILVEFGLNIVQEFKQFEDELNSKAHQFLFQIYEDYNCFNDDKYHLWIVQNKDCNINGYDEKWMNIFW